MNRIVNFKLGTFVFAIFNFSFFLFDKEVFFCLFVLFIVFMALSKQNIFDFFINLIAAILFNFIYAKYNSINFIPFNQIFHSLIGVDLRSVIVEHVEENFSIDSAGFIKLIIFNIKDDSIKDFYNKLSELSLSHLVVVSGFHLSLIPIIISKLIKKKYLSIPINIFLMLFLNYLTAFSFGSFRAFLFYIFSINKKTRKVVFPLSLLIIMFIAPLSVLTLSLQMSYLAIFAISISKTNNNNKNWKNILLIPIVCTMFITPYIGYLSKKLSLFFVIYSLVFTPLILFLYILTLMFFWLPQYEFMLKYLLIFIFNFINLVSIINVFIPIYSTSPFLSFIYWIILFLIFGKRILYNISDFFKILYLHK